MVLKSRYQSDSRIEIGIDEAGRGSFWGPIMAGATVLPPEPEWTDAQKDLFSQIRDSKKMTPKKREKVYDQIKELVPCVAVGRVDADEINEHGIQWANQEAFRRAIHGLELMDVDLTTETRLLIDGVLAIGDWKGEQKLVVEGDNLYLAIATSSILAKVEHDHWIRDYCLEHPECEERYHLLSSKGYGTARHREGIRLYGGHPLHREVYIEGWLPGATVQPKRKSKKKGSDEESCMIQFNEPTLS